MSEQTCKRCGETLPTSEFKADTRYKSGFTSWCYACHREANRDWYEKNKKKQNKKAVAWRKSNPEKAARIWREFHDRHKEKRAADHAIWAKNNRDKRNAASAKRKAAKLQSTPKWVNFRKVKEIYRLARRLEDFTGVKMHVDHIVPLQGEGVCGLHWEGNLQILTASENCAKHNKLIDEATRQPDLFIAPPEKPTQEEMGL